MVRVPRARKYIKCQHCLDPINTAGHNLRCQTHGELDWSRQGCAAGGLGHLRMVHLIRLHPIEDGAGPAVSHGDLGQVPIEVTLHLTLGLDHEAQAPFVAHQPGEGTDAKGARVPQGIKEALAVPELTDAGLTPTEVVVFFPGRALHAALYLGLAGGEGLAMIQGLGAYLPGVVDPHQACDVFAFLLGKISLGDALGRIGSPGSRWPAEDGAYGLVEIEQDPVDGAEIAYSHG